MNRSRIKYVSGLLLFGLNGIIASKIMLSSTDIVFYRTLAGSVFLILLCAAPGIFRRFGGRSAFDKLSAIDGMSAVAGVPAPGRLPAAGDERPAFGELQAPDKLSAASDEWPAFDRVSAAGGLSASDGMSAFDGVPAPGRLTAAGDGRPASGEQSASDGQTLSMGGRRLSGSSKSAGHESRAPRGMAYCSRGSLHIMKYPRQLAAVVLSGISMGLSWIFLYEAYRRIGVGLSSVTYYCGPVIVMMLAPLVFRSRLTGRQIICFAAAFAGILMVSLPGVTGDAKVDAFGLICGFASALLHALMVIFTMKAPCITGMVNSAIQLAVSFITVALPAAVVWLICTAGHSTGSMAAVFGSSLAIPDEPEQWFWVLFLGIVNTGVGCWLYFSEIAALPVITVSILGYLEPLSAVFFAVILLGESMTAWEWTGAVLILGSAAVSDLRSGGSKDTDVS